MLPGDVVPHFYVIGYGVFKPDDVLIYYNEQNKKVPFRPPLSTAIVTISTSVLLFPYSY